MAEYYETIETKQKGRTRRQQRQQQQLLLHQRRQVQQRHPRQQQPQLHRQQQQVRQQQVQQQQQQQPKQHQQQQLPLQLRRPAPQLQQLQQLQLQQEVPTTTATTTPTCGKNPDTTGAFFSYNTGSAPTTYTLNSHTFTANDSSSTLTFILSGDPGPKLHYWLLDDVSVNDTATNTNILVNGNFDQGTLNGWTQFCATDANCGNGNYGQLTNSPCRSAPDCYVDTCSGSNFDYLLQSFGTVPGNRYIVSFYMEVFASGGGHLAYVTLS
ncbi:unnamed protein product [Rotaria magnacalcarata]|uniref:Uncharacterized protein n=2 Tax=Rotaria magnacalcarata TaxID=392030 RepID=A0A816RQ94_9BILA|nr:unnamed protein product [Rotaria magnacalcarata]